MFLEFNSSLDAVQHQLKNPDMKIKFNNFILVFVSILITYSAIEFLVFRHVIRHLPLNKHLFLPKPVRILAQSSKHDIVPRKDYIAIFGDSYAMGYGDWLMEADPKKNSPFNSAHVLHDLTGKDVVSFGQSGRGSLGGFVIEPIKKFKYINNLWLFELSKPGIVCLYFYEGNDLEDNLEYIRRKYRGEYDYTKIYDQDYFRMFIDGSVQKATLFNFFKNFIFGRFIQTMLSENIERLFSRKNESEPPEDSIEFDYSEETNRAAVGEKELVLPSSLQGPALGLDSEQMKLALYVLDQSLKYIRGYFKESRFAVVYIPSVLSSYTIVSEAVQGSKSGDRIFSTEEMFENSGLIAEKVRSMATKNGMQFIDTRADIRKAARRKLVHGPHDWKHLNRLGYHVLARSIFEKLDY